MSKFFVAFLVFSVAGLCMFNSVDAQCKSGEGCTEVNCPCFKILPGRDNCCEGFYCDSGITRSGTCQPNRCKGTSNCENCWCSSIFTSCCAGHYCNTSTGVCTKENVESTEFPWLTTENVNV